MGKMSFRIEGEQALKQALSRAANVGTGASLARTTMGHAARIVDRMRALAREDTGEMKRKTRAVVVATAQQTADLEFQSNAAHAGVNEFGSEKMPAQPFFRPPLDAFRANAERDLGRDLGAQIEQAARLG
jgi:HK97 gp10 family phage protein